MNAYHSEFSDVAERVPELIQDLDAEREDDISQTVLALREVRKHPHPFHGIRLQVICTLAR